MKAQLLFVLLHVACTLQTMILGEGMATLREIVNLDQFAIDLLYKSGFSQILDPTSNKSTNDSLIVPGGKEIDSQAANKIYQA